MQIETFQYRQSSWSVDKFSDLDSKSTLVLVFGAPEYSNNHEPFDDLKKTYPNSIIAGCSTAGEILNDEISDHSISVAVIKFENTKIIKVCTVITESEESRQAGEQLSEKLKGDNLKSVLILSDGVNVNGTELIKGIRKKLSNNVVVTGGLAGDGDQFKETWVLDEKPKSKVICAIGFYGKCLNVSYGSKGGWDIFGPLRRITRSKDNTLYELDNQPALSLYKKYLGDRAKGLPATALLFPLSISKPTHKEPVVRTILSVNEEESSLTFAGNMPEGWNAQLMCANFDRLIEGAADAAVATAENNGQGAPIDDVLVIAISCVGRRLVLGERTEEEIDAVMGNLPANSNLIGFYSYGEISPTGLKNCDLHNQTMTLTTFYEEKNK